MKNPLPTVARALLACLFAASTQLHAAAIFTPNSMPTGWVGEIDVSSFDFGDGTQTIFKGDYIKGAWTGDLSAFPVDGFGTVLFDAQRWSASDELDAQVVGTGYDTARRIVTLMGDGTKIPFRWESMDATQRSKFDNDKTKGPNLVNHLRGDRTNETPKGAQYRSRTHVLGDIIHSRPLFVDHPTAPRVYVGANDGMLHSFDTDTGDEVFAYVPSFFISPVDTTKFSPVRRDDSIWRVTLRADCLEFLRARIIGGRLLGLRG